MIVETRLDVMNTEDPTLHTESIPKDVMKKADSSLSLEHEKVDVSLYPLAGVHVTLNLLLYSISLAKPDPRLPVIHIQRLQ